MAGSPEITKQALESLYLRYNSREFVHPDPLEFLYNYSDLTNREIVGIIASSLAYGRVSQIIRSVSWVLDQMSPSPLRFLNQTSKRSLERTFSGFKHRFTTGDELASMLFGIKQVIERYGSLQKPFLHGLTDADETIIPALTMFAKQLRGNSNGRYNSLLPYPKKGSALKRFNLFLRWMIRRDDVDPGGWSDVPASKLIVPLDTHMHQISLALGLTQRKLPDMKTAMEITQAFKKIAPKDPVRYDFVLTRFGIRKDAHIKSTLEQYIASGLV
ncbi:MAG: TIGR02757 family protein [Thermodesulfobacteriota bacterium]|nr:TIGR02757 family protein [Thermodesulfobacteriota bacterium]